MRGPACVIDCRAGRLLWINAEGERAFGLGPAPGEGGAQTGGIALDKAMPLFSELSAIHDTLLAGDACFGTLRFWTDCGPKSIGCDATCLNAEQAPDAILLRARSSNPPAGLPAEKKAPTSIFPRWRDRKHAAVVDTETANCATPSGAARVVSVPASGRDLDTLQQIAQQIRQSRPSGSTLVAAAPKPGSSQARSETGAVTSDAACADGELGSEPAGGMTYRSATAETEPLADLGHELRTPLGAIRGFADLLARERFGPLGHEKYAGYVRDIQASAAHALSLVEDLTETDDSNCELHLCFSDIEVNQIADECLSAMRPLAEQAGVRLAGDLGLRLPKAVADRRSLKQIVLNLLSNAIRFTAPGGTATLVTEYLPGEELRIDVKDTGIGMSPETVARVTGAGEQTADGGAPLSVQRRRGLQLVRRLAVANGAELVIDSRPGVGSTVTVSFPAGRLVLV